jgi:membrane-bound serine protease (ClpP class)
LPRAAALAALAAVLAGAAPLAARDPAAGPGTLVRVVIDGTINPAVADHLRQAIEHAAAAQAPALLVQLDTPGGLLVSTRAIVKEILTAPLPVIVWVGPSGAGAGSAGVFITLAAHVAAMAPGTNIGAAHPVTTGGGAPEGALGEKIENFTATFGEAIAQQRGRNVEWAEKAVRESLSATAAEAAKLRVVDFIARDLGELLEKADGRKVEVAGARRVLALGKAVRAPDGGIRVVDLEMTLGQRVLNVIADPNIAYLLMMAGMLGLWVEFTHPGVMFPGVAGAICLLLGLTALHVLPVSASGLALLVLGLALLLAEAFVPTGLLGAGGVAAILFGSLFLFDAETGVRVSRRVVFAVAGLFSAFLILVATVVVRGQRRPVAVGAEAMVGEIGLAQQRLAPTGTVLVHGEYWTADSDEPVDAGERVRVTAVEGLRLRVRRA